MIIQDVIQFTSSLHDVYEAIVDEEKHKRFSKNDNVELSRRVGGKCNWYNSMEGEILEFIQDSKYEHTWRAKDWPVNHYAKVTMIFSTTEDGTRLDFTLKNPPPTSPLDEEKWKMGWNIAYWTPIKEFLGETPASSIK